MKTKQEGEKPREITVYDILKVLSRSNFNTQSIVGVSEFCPFHSARRIDAYAYNTKATWGYEIKISRKDFTNDGKWKEYLQYCNYFYFVAPEGLINKSELPERIGLIEVSWHMNWENNNYLTSEVIKRAKRLSEISSKNMDRIQKGLIFKLVYNKNLLKAEI